MEICDKKNLGKYLKVNYEGEHGSYHFLLKNKKIQSLEKHQSLGKRNLPEKVKFSLKLVLGGRENKYSET